MNSTATQLERQRRIRTLLKGIETGDPASVEVIHPNQYIQHNPQTHEGRSGLAALFERISESSPRVNIVRIFSDGDYVFAHTEYDFSTRRIGFEVFRFEGLQTVEHWDNIQPRQGPNWLGCSMVDGPTEVQNLAATAVNRALVQAFIDAVLVGRQIERFGEFVDGDRFVEHAPEPQVGLLSLCEMAAGQPLVRVQRLHRVLAEGNFVLAVCEGVKDDVRTAFYDLYRVAEGKLVEHWNTVEHVAPESEWKNDNGKF